VEREQGHLDREGHEEGQEQPSGRGHREIHPGERLEVEGGLAEDRARAEVQEQDGHQQERRAGHREQEELHRGVDPPLVSPHPDDEVHGEQQPFEEHEEQQEVEGHEGPEHGRLQKEE
jgi:hypothetical protein